MYQNQLAKFKSAKLNSDIFLAKVQAGEEKKLSHVKLQVNQSHIQGSEMWKIAREGDRSAMRTHFGQMCVKIEIKIPFESEEVISSCLIQDDVAVTANQESNESHEFCTNYFVHSGKTGNGKVSFCTFKKYFQAIDPANHVMTTV